MPILKKIFFSSLAIFITTLLLWGVYLLSFKKETPKNTVETPVQSAPLAIDVPQKTEAPKMQAISDEAVLSPVFSPDGLSIKYYSKNSGKAYQIDTDGQNKKVISDKELIGLSNVSWSYDKSKVITKLSQGTGTKFFLYDYEASKGTPLKSNLDEVVWQSDSNKIFYKYFDPKTKDRTLNISDPDGTNWKKLADIDYRYLSVSSVPKTGIVSFWNRPDAYDASTLESIPIIGGDRKIILQGKFGADYLWDNLGNTFLMSSVDSKGGTKIQLATANFNGGEYKSLGIPTFVSKCVWSKNNKVVYYALPNGIPAGAVLPNDWQDGKFNSVDTFWKIDIASGETSRIIEPKDMEDAKIDAVNLFLNTDESYLYFTNKIDGKLYRIAL